MKTLKQTHYNYDFLCALCCKNIMNLLILSFGPGLSVSKIQESGELPWDNSGEWSLASISYSKIYYIEHI